MKENILLVLFAVACLVGALWVGNKFVSVVEKDECKEWTMQATRLKDYYFTQWQADQCSAHGIQVNAPIK